MRPPLGEKKLDQAAENISSEPLKNIKGGIAQDLFKSA